MKVKINKGILKIVKVSGFSVMVACGSGGGGGLKSVGVDASGLNPKKVTGSAADAVGGDSSEDSNDIQSPQQGQPIEQSNDPAGAENQQENTNPGIPGNGPAAPAQGPMGDNLPQDPGTPAKDPDIQKIFAKTGIRNFAQLNATMSALTGVPTTNAQVAAFYAAQATSLPTENDVKGFIGSHQVTVFKLAVEYCDVLVKDTALRTAIFGTFNFAAAPNVALTPDTKKALADNLVSKFWGMNLSTLSPHGDNVAMVVTLIDDLLSGRDLTIATQTPGVVTGTCAGVLSSAPVTLY